MRGAAASTLRDAAPGAVLALLAGSADDAATDERRLVEIEALRRAGDEAPAAYRGRLCAWARTHPTAEIRARAAGACVESGAAGEELLLAMAGDPDWPVRARVALALNGQPGRPGGPEALGRLQRDPHPTVRRAATAPRRRGTSDAAYPEGTGTGRQQ